MRPVLSLLWLEYNKCLLSPFTYRGVLYVSVEGFWQMMKYLESETDMRAVRTFPYTRTQVTQMVAFEAKNA